MSNSIYRLPVHVLANMVSQITNNNIQTDDPAWLQASLPVGNGGLGIRSAAHLLCLLFSFC